MRFCVPIRSPGLLSAAAAHGMVDFARPSEQLAVYLLALLPVPGRLSTTAFGLASVVHFASDLTLLGSIVLHCAAAALSVARSPSFGFDLMLRYMSGVHIPLLVVRLIAASKWEALAVLGYATLFASTRVRRVLGNDGTYVLCERQQLVVACHVLVSVFFD